jgi:hypothetical protein
MEGNYLESFKWLRNINEILKSIQKNEKHSRNLISKLTLTLNINQLRNQPLHQTITLINLKTLNNPYPNFFAL